MLVKTSFLCFVLPISDWFREGYCIATIFILLNNTQLNYRNNIKSYSTSIILPHIEHNTDRKEILKIPDLRTFSKRQYQTQLIKIFNDCDKVLCSCIPERQADGGRRHSSTLKICFIKVRTPKWWRSFYHYALSNFVWFFFPLFYCHQLHYLILSIAYSGIKINQSIKMCLNEHCQNLT